MILRDYQISAIEKLRALYAQGRKSPCLVMPTGAGKTPTAAAIIKSALAKGKRVGFLAGRIELLDQAREKLHASGVDDVRVIQADNDTSTTASVFVASAQTFASSKWRGQLPPADILVVDECQHLKARTWLEIAAHYPIRLGLTATPERGDGSALGDVLDSLVVGATVKQLTERGYLVPCRVYAPTQILDTRTLAQEPVDAYLAKCPDTKCIVFCGTVEHARLVAESFRSRGIPAEHVSGAMGNRPNVIARFISGEFRVLVNVSLLIEGFDDPAIESTIFARRFTHAGSYLQALGRILRPHGSKTKATAVDLCGSALVHGTPDLERTYSLEGKAISGADRLAIRQCPGCGGVFSVRDVCPYCALELPKAERSIPKAGRHALGEVTAETERRPWFSAIEAKHPGVCFKCKVPFAKGTRIVWSKGIGSRHQHCNAKKAAA